MITLQARIVHLYNMDHIIDSSPCNQTTEYNKDKKPGVRDHWGRHSPWRQPPTGLVHYYCCCCYVASLLIHPPPSSLSPAKKLDCQLIPWKVITLTLLWRTGAACWGAAAATALLLPDCKDTNVRKVQNVQGVFFFNWDPPQNHKIFLVSKFWHFFDGIYYVIWHF